jgi:hypothetical protein
MATAPCIIYINTKIKEGDKGEYGYNSIDGHPVFAKGGMYEKTSFILN